MDWTNMCVFIICARMLIHFRPKANYEKYLKMLVSVMILLQLVEPFGGLGNWGDPESASGQVSRFQEELEERRQEVLEKYEEEVSASQAEESTVLVEVPEIDTVDIQIGEGGNEDAGD